MLTKTTYMLVAMAARLLSTVGAFLLIARAWTPEQFGVFMYPYALAAVLSRIVDYGFALQLARELGPELQQLGVKRSQNDLAAMLTAIFSLTLLHVAPQPAETACRVPTFP